MENFRFDQLRMVNFRRFVEAKVVLDPKLTVFVGRNGAGKSSVLSALSILMSWIIARIRNESGKGQYVRPSDVHNGCASGYVAADTSIGEMQVPSVAKPGVVKSHKFDIDSIKPFASEIRSAYTDNRLDSLPVFISYGVKRAVVEIPLRLRSHDYTMMDAFDKCLEGAANFREFFTWFRMSEDWENEMRTRHDNDIRHSGLEAFRKAMRIFMPDYSDFRVKRHPLSLVASKNGQTLNLDQLSDGEKIYIALIGDMCHRLSLANPNSDPLLGQGVVLIDEIDLHLHPQWQSEIASRLINTFPNIQFVVTTHSPHVVNSVPTSCIRVLDETQQISNVGYGYGMPSSIVLHDIMTLNQDVPLAVAEGIEGFYSSVDNQDKVNAERFFNDVQEMVPKHPELTRMRKIKQLLLR